MSVSVLPGNEPSRSATIRIRGVELQTPCAAFCTTDHAGEDLVHIEDLTHEDQDEAVAAPVGINGRTEDILAVRLAQYPFAGGSETVVVLDGNGSGETAELSPTRALAELDRIAAHINRQRQRILDATRNITPEDKR